LNVSDCNHIILLRQFYCNYWWGKTLTSPNFCWPSLLLPSNR
jgi:hypothetical protein